MAEFRHLHFNKRVAQRHVQICVFNHSFYTQRAQKCMRLLSKNVENAILDESFSAH